MWYLSRFTTSISVKTGSNSLASHWASAAPIRKLMIVPTFPNTASRTSSGIWATYWLAIARFSRYLRASLRMEPKLCVAKFWNSST